MGSRFIVVLVGPLLAAVAMAQPPRPLGSEFEVREGPGSPPYNAGTPAVTMLPSGNFIVAWAGVDIQMFDSNGEKIGDSFRISEGPSVAAGPRFGRNDLGEFVIVWSRAECCLLSSLRGRVFDNTAHAIGSEFSVGPLGTSFGGVSMHTDGSFVVTYSTEYSYPDYHWDTQARRFASDGTPVGDYFTVNSYTTGDQFSQDIAMDANGDFVIVWNDWYDAQYEELALLGRKFSKEGVPVGSEFRIDRANEGSPARAAIDMNPAGDFIVVWEDSPPSPGSDTDGRSIQARRFGSDATPTGDYFQVNTYTTRSQIAPQLTITEDGSFVIVWTSAGSEGTDTQPWSIQGRWFTRNATPSSSDFQVNTFTPYWQKYADIDTGSDGNFVVVWSTSYDPGVFDPFRGQRFGPPKLLFVDDFESGDTSAWSSSQ